MRTDLEWEYADSEVSETKINDLGLKVGFSFPQDYIDCVKINGGASVIPEEFNVDAAERCFGSLFSFDEESSEYIFKKYEIYKAFLPEKVFPIACDPAGNLICFDYENKNESPIVVFWEHENASEKEMLMKEGLTEEQAEERARDNVLFVAATFTEFLEKLHD